MPLMKEEWWWACCATVKHAKPCCVSNDRMHWFACLLQDALKYAVCLQQNIAKADDLLLAVAFQPASLLSL